MTDESQAERSTHTLSTDALARYNREQERKKRRAERAARRGEGPVIPERAKRASRDGYRSEDHHIERPKKHAKSKKRRVVSGAVMEEGMARSGIRGGGSFSDDGYEKEDFYREPRKKKKNKKKLCA